MLQHIDANFALGAHKTWQSRRLEAKVNRSNLCFSTLIVPEKVQVVIQKG